jgi:hypothetical protein
LLYLRIFSAFLMTFLSPKNTASVITHVLVHYEGLWGMIYCWVWFCRFALFDSIIKLRYIHDCY